MLVAGGSVGRALGVRRLGLWDVMAALSRMFPKMHAQCEMGVCNRYLDVNFAQFPDVFLLVAVVERQVAHLRPALGPQRRHNRSFQHFCRISSA